MKRIAVFVASMALMVGALVGVASVAAHEAPAAVESLKAPITTNDVCMCGGYIVMVYPCTYVRTYPQGYWTLYYNPVTGAQWVGPCSP